MKISCDWSVPKYLHVNLYFYLKIIFASKNSKIIYNCSLKRDICFENVPCLYYKKFFRHICLSTVQVICFENFGFANVNYLNSGGLVWKTWSTFISSPMFYTLSIPYRSQASPTSFFLLNLSS